MPFNLLRTFDFLATVMVYNFNVKKWEITTADIVIKTADRTIAYSGTLAAIINKITLRDNSMSYTITVSKAGYTTYTSVFTSDELKQYLKSEDKGPLIINLNESVTDIDGNTYNTAVIGTQVWMAENLKVTKYNEGTALQLVTNMTPNPLFSKFTQVYSWYNFDPGFKDIYGALYSSGVVHSYPDKNICPVGWHPSNSSDWLSMLLTLDPNSTVDFAHVSEIAGAGLKAKGTIEEGNGYWHVPNTGATNESGFTGLPGGRFDNTFQGMGYFGYWWIHFETRVLSNNSIGVFGSETDSGGLSIRCVKD